MNKIVKRSLKWLIVLFVLIGIAAAVTALLPDDEARTEYRTSSVTKGNIREVVTSTGTLNPVQLINVGTQVSGQVSKLYVQINDHVQAGQLLAEIDPALLEAQVKQSRASRETARISFEQAKRDMDRTKALLEKDYVAKVDLERAEQSYMSARNSYDSAKTQVERDEVNLSYTKITSPIDGVVISQDITLGQTVAASFQTPNLFKIAGDMTKMKIDVNLTESDIGKVKTGQAVTFTVDAFPDREFTGSVQTVNLNPNNASGVVTYTTVVEVLNPEQLLLPGMTAYVSITLSEIKDVLRVPASALRFTPPQKKIGGMQRLFSVGVGSGGGGGRRGNAPSSESGRNIYLLDSGEPRPVPITVGATDETFVQVSGNIQEGDPVITGIVPKRR